MAKPQIKHNPKVKQIFEDLDNYRQFCVDYGYVFNEATLYDMRNFVYRQHTKQLQGKSAKYNWEEAIVR
jgi:hypothetical protein